MNKVINQLSLLFARWNEFLFLPIAVLLLVFSPELLRLVDAEAGALDVGVLQLNILGLVKFLFASGFAWLFLKWSKPELYKSIDQGYKKLTSFDASKDRLTSADIQENENLQTCLRHSLYIYLFYLGSLLYAMTAV